MGKNQVYELEEFMSVFWTDGLDIIPVSADDQPENKQDSQNNEQGKSDKKDLRKKVETQILRIIRDTKAAKELKEIYKHTCQICRTALRLSDRLYSEAHHLHPLAKEGDDIKENMIVVCANHHVLLDEGAIAIDPQTLKVIDFNGIELSTLLVNPDHGLGKQYIEYHFYKRFKRKTI